MTTAWSHVSLFLIARATSSTSSFQHVCSSSIDHSRSPPVCVLVRSQLNVVGRGLETCGAGCAARAMDIEPGKNWSSLCFLLGITAISRLSSSSRSPENVPPANVSAGLPGALSLRSSLTFFDLVEIYLVQKTSQVRFSYPLWLV